MVNDDVIQQIKIDVFSFGSIDDLIGLKEEDRVDFLEWFRINANEYTQSEKLSLDLPLSKMHDGNCFDNTHAITVNYDLKCFEGFAFVETYGNYFPHGFNLNNGKVEDYTLNKEGKYLNIDCKYCGVEIPISYVKEMRTNKKLGSINDNNLIVQFYYDSIKL